MPGFDNILLVAAPGEDPQQAVARLCRLVNAGGRLTIASLCEDLPDDVAELLQDPAVMSVRAEIDARRLQQFEGYVDAARSAGIEVRTRELSGIPFLEIIRAVLADGYDLVVKAAEPSVGLHAAFFGSTDRHLLRKCPCPLWLADPAGAATVSRILAAVDPSPRSDTQRNLSREVLELAQHLAQRFGAALDVVHAWQVLGDRILGATGRKDPETVQLIGETLNRHQRWLDELLREAGIDAAQATLHLVRGYAGEVVPEVARATRSDIILMGTVGRVGIPGLLIGNTAERILGEVDCSVLAVKPEGFVSPVTPAGPSH
ncbi:MAG: universal stress protein [Gammaproteobacteria bacterium]|nr:universal stress protein [Gammaproteobacteria bacterium]